MKVEKPDFCKVPHSDIPFLSDCFQVTTIFYPNNLICVDTVSSTNNIKLMSCILPLDSGFPS